MFGLFKKRDDKAADAAPEGAPAAARPDPRMARHEPIPLPTVQEGDGEQDWEQWQASVQNWDPASAVPPPPPTFEPTMPLTKDNEKP